MTLPSSSVTDTRKIDVQLDNFVGYFVSNDKDTVTAFGVEIAEAEVDRIRDLVLDEMAESEPGPTSREVEIENTYALLQAAAAALTVLARSKGKGETLPWGLRVFCETLKLQNSGFRTGIVDCEDLLNEIEGEEEDAPDTKAGSNVGTIGVRTDGKFVIMAGPSKIVLEREQAKQFHRALGQMIGVGG